MPRHPYTLELVCIGNQLADNGVVCPNVGSVRDAALECPQFPGVFAFICDEIGIPEATWTVQEQYRFAMAKERANA